MSGRKKFYEALDVTKEYVIALIQEHTYATIVARKLGVDKEAVRRFMIAENIPIVPGRPKVRDLKKSENRMIDRWFLANPGKKLPMNSKEAAALVGCDVSTVNYYKQTKSRRALKIIEELGDFRKLGLILDDIQGRKINFKFVTEYTMKIKPSSFNVIIKGSIGSHIYFEINVAYSQLYKQLTRKDDEC